MTIDVEILSSGIRVLASGGDNASSDYVRPADWPTMPTDAANKISILAAVYDTDSNYVAVNVTVTGGYTVDWGDGTSDNVASGVQADHQYTYADGDLSSATVAGNGYKTATIVITPQVANDITAFNLGVKNATSGLSTYSNPWLDIVVNAPACTSLAFRGPCEARSVERVVINAIGDVTTLASAFLNFYSLQSVSFPSGSLSSVTTLASAFLACHSLKSVSFPSGSLASVTTLASAFQSCSSLQSVSFPSGSLASVTTLANAFPNCYSLQSVSFPSGSLASVTTLANAFQSCSSLQSVSFPSGWTPSSLTNTTNTFVSCLSLANIDNCAIPVSFSVASALLSSAGLDEIYTALPSASATITVTGNYGTTGDDPSIATGKGWTVTA